MSPSDLIQLRRDFVSRVRSLAASTQDANLELMASCPEHVRHVLKAASPSGLNVSLLATLLLEIDDYDHELAADLMRGFPLVGPIPADLAAPWKVTRTAKCDACTLADNSIANRARLAEKHMAEVSSSRAKDDEAIWQQTVAEVGLLRP